MQLLSEQMISRVPRHPRDVLVDCLVQLVIGLTWVNGTRLAYLTLEDGEIRALPIALNRSNATNRMRMTDLAIQSVALWNSERVTSPARRRLT